MNNILVTGASGFIGKHFQKSNKEKYNIKTCSLRTKNWVKQTFEEVDCILHLAGIAHQKNITAQDIYRKVNTDLTIELAKNAKENGIKHFIFMSSVKVYGDSYSKQTLNINSETIPTDAYGISKLEAEKELSLMNDVNFKVSIVRTPVVYGPQAKGNMLTLMKHIYKGTPLPLGDIDNKRSLVSIDNLNEMLNRIIDLKADGIFIAGDDHAISTSQLINYIVRGLNVKANIFKLPFLGRKFIKLLKPGFYNRVFNSFEIDNKESLDRLNIKNQIPTHIAIEKMTNWYKQSSV